MNFFICQSCLTFQISFVMCYIFFRTFPFWSKITTPDPVIQKLNPGKHWISLCKKLSCFDLRKCKGFVVEFNAVDNHVFCSVQYSVRTLNIYYSIFIPVQGSLQVYFVFDKRTKKKYLHRYSNNRSKNYPLHLLWHPPPPKKKSFIDLLQELGKRMLNFCVHIEDYALYFLFLPLNAHIT